MFVVGATGFLAEVIRGTDRPNVLFGSLALMAGAAFLRGLRNGRNGT